MMDYLKTGLSFPQEARAILPAVAGTAIQMCLQNERIGKIAWVLGMLASTRNLIEEKQLSDTRRLIDVGHPHDAVLLANTGKAEYVARYVLPSLKSRFHERVNTLSSATLRELAIAVSHAVLGILVAGALSMMEPVLDSAISSAWEGLSGRDLQESDQDSRALLKMALSFFKPLAILPALAIGVLGPIVEEFLFRGELQEYLKDRIKEWKIPAPVRFTALVLSTTAIFAAIHYTPFQTTQKNFTVFCSACICGVIMSCLKEGTGSLASSTAMHIAWNSGRTVNFLLGRG